MIFFGVRLHAKSVFEVDSVIFDRLVIELLTDPTHDRAELRMIRHSHRSAEDFSGWSERIHRVQRLLRTTSRDVEREPLGAFDERMHGLRPIALARIAA